MVSLGQHEAEWKGLPHHRWKQRHKELCDAARKRDIRIDLYFSHPDWYDGDFRPYAYHPLQVPSSDVLTTEYADVKKRLGDEEVIVPDATPAEVSRMMARHRAQLTELLTRYGDIDMLCLDQWLGPKVWPMLRETILHLRKLQPDVMLRARGIGNYGDYFTPEGFVPGDKANTDTPWFVIYPLGSSFSYERRAENYKGAAWVVRNLVDTAAKGGNFMDGIGPDGDGHFHPTAVSQLKEVGAWLKINGRGYLCHPCARWRTVVGGCGHPLHPHQGSANHLCVRVEVARRETASALGSAARRIRDSHAGDECAIAMESNKRRHRSADAAWHGG